MFLPKALIAVHCSTCTRQLQEDCPPLCRPCSEVHLVFLRGRENPKTKKLTIASPQGSGTLPWSSNPRETVTRMTVQDSNCREIPANRLLWHHGWPQNILRSSTNWQQLSDPQRDPLGYIFVKINNRSIKYMEAYKFVLAFGGFWYAYVSPIFMITLRTVFSIPTFSLCT